MVFAATSMEAYRKVIPGSPALQERIIKALEEVGSKGLTSSEATDATGIPLLTVRPQMTCLYQAGIIKREGKRVNRVGRSEYVMVLA
jgi:DNA-binding Lrp family transcriptional regulator